MPPYGNAEAAGGMGMPPYGNAEAAGGMGMPPYGYGNATGVGRQSFADAAG